jgi:hypothetical protein
MQVRVFLIITVILVCSYISYGQYGSFGLTDARQLGLANTYASNCRELYAAGKNPAFLACHSSDKKLDILFPNLSMREYNIAKVSTFIDDYFSQSKIDIITGFDGSMIENAFTKGGKLFMGLQIGFMGVGYTPSNKIGSFSFAMKDFLTGYLQLPTGLVDYVNSDYPDMKAVYFNDFHFQATWMRYYELSYGRAFHIYTEGEPLEIYAGIGVKYINGFIYNDISLSGGAGYIDEDDILFGTYTASSLSAYSDDIDIDNIFNGEDVISDVPFMKPVGKGAGFDFGFGLKSERGIKVGFSLTDAGFINWTGKTRKTLVTGEVRIDSTLSLDDIDSLANLVKIEKISDNQFQTLPVTAFHAGFTFMLDRFIKNFPGDMELTFELHQGLAESVTNPEFPRVSTALSWKPGKWWPVVLTGISNGLNHDFVWSAGFGYELSFLELYVSSPNIIPLIEGNSLNALSLSMCWHFIKEKQKKDKRKD